MDGQQQQDPPLTYQDPRAYILYLKTKRVPASQIAMMVQERFGPGKSPEQRAKDAANAEAQGNLASGLGQLGGTLGGAYLMNNLGSLFGGGATSGVMGNTPGIMSAMKEAGMINSAGTSGSGAFNLGGIGSSGNAILPIAGTIGMADLLANQRTGRRGYLQGAASGAAMGSYFGPVGTGVGALVGLGAAGANELFDTNKFKTEGNRLQKLIDQGINIPESLRAPMYQTKGRSKQELIEEAKRTGGNVKFAESRNEADLRPEDIWGYSAFFKKFGNDWLGGLTEAQRRGIAQKALEAGAVREHHGTIDVDWGKVELPEDLTKIGPKQGPVIPRPKKGEVARVSPGMYRNDQGKLVQAETMRQALERSYNNTKERKK